MTGDVIGAGPVAGAGPIPRYATRGRFALTEAGATGAGLRLPVTGRA